jgi:hypothetical protein
MKPIDNEMIDLLKKSGSKDSNVSKAAMYQIAKALELPLREAVLSGDILGNIFETVDVTNGVTAEFPLDLIVPGTEKDYVAYTIPKAGAVPHRNVEGDYVQVPTFEIGNAIDWLLKYARDARWDIVARAMQVLEAGFVKKRNDDGWHTILGAGVDRNILVFDGDAAAGQFTKRLVSLAKVVMRRNGGGNSSSINRGSLTDLYLSPECMEDIRNWGVDQVDEVTRREIYVAGDGQVNRLFSVNLHDLDELGEGQEYQSFFTGSLSGALASGDVELLVGLDLRNRSSFVSPLGEALEVFPDDMAHRSRRAGLYAWEGRGYSVLDGRKVLLLSC